MWGSMPGSVTTIAVSKLDNVKNLTINVDTDNSLISDALYDEFINAISTDEDSVLFCRTAYWVDMCLYHDIKISSDSIW